MARKIRHLVAGNWKMNGLKKDIKELKTLISRIKTAKTKPVCDILVCPPATLIKTFSAEAKSGNVKIGGQDCHANESGAHTGDISAEMIKDVGGRFCILGHSERRADHDETSHNVRLKALAALRAGLTAIICVGETSRERKLGKTSQIVGGQLKGSLPEGANAKNVIIAYEPVWAIGTGVTPTAEEVEKTHAYLRKRLVALLGDEGEKVKILYGGSVKPSNAAELMAVENVNGALVGGASLKAKDFLGIIASYQK